MYYWSLGDVARGSNKLEDARRYYQLALQLDRTTPRRRSSSATSNSFLGNFDEARKDYETGMTVAGRPTPRSWVPSRRSRTSTQGEPSARSRRSKISSSVIDSSGRGQDQRLNAKVAR
jgi:hypothetical protein